MNIISKTFNLLPMAILLGLGMGIFYLFVIMFLVTGRLPDIGAFVNSLPGFD